MINGANTRTVAAGALDLKHPRNTEVARVEDGDGVWKVVGCGEIFSVAGHGDVACVQPGPRFGHNLQPPQVEFGDPAVAGGEKHIAAIGGEFRAAMERIACFESVERLKLIAIHDRGVMVARLDHDKKVERIALEDGFLLRSRGGGEDAARTDLGLTPHRRPRERGIDITRERADIGRRHLTEGWHLSAFAPVGDGFGSLVLAKALEAFRNQGRALAA